MSHWQPVESVHCPVAWRVNADGRRAEKQQVALEAWGQDLEPGDTIRVVTSSGLTRAVYVCGVDFKIHQTEAADGV